MKFSKLNDICLKASFELFLSLIAKDKGPVTLGKLLVEAAEIHAKQHGIKLKHIHSFVSKYCQKTHRNHCLRFTKTSRKITQHGRFITKLNENSFSKQLSLYIFF